MITIENLTVAYVEEKRIIDSLDVAFSPGTIHGIVGLNGAGKTTLLNAIFGLKKKQSGTITYNGVPINKREMSYLMTESFFYSNITGREYLRLFKNKQFHVDRWNDLFLLPLDEIIDTYSSGMKKKLALLGILMQNKPVMVLDEPFNNLDIESCRIIRSILLKLKDMGKTILITSHIIETLTNLCDTIYYLEQGKIKNTISKPDFGKFEQEIFSAIESRNEKLVAELLGSAPLSGKQVKLYEPAFQRAIEHRDLFRRF